MAYNKLDESAEECMKEGMLIVLKSFLIMGIMAGIGFGVLRLIFWIFNIPW